MAATRELLDSDTADTPSSVLAGLHARQACIDADEAAKLRYAVAWAAIHSADSIVTEADWAEGPMPVAGAGTLDVGRDLRTGLHPPDE